MKKGLVALLVLFVAASLGGCESFAASGTARAETLAEGQSEVYGKVVAATGNDITLALGDPAQAEQAAPGERQDAEASAGGAGEGASERPAGGGARDGGASGGAPSGFPEEMGEAPSGMGGGAESASGRGRGARQSLELTGEEVTYRIPVGTPVAVASGESALTTSFMRIDIDNVVRLVLQEVGGEEVVVAAQIIS